MPSLIRKKPLDAQGKPLDANGLYEPVSAHGRGFRVYNPGVTVLRGDDPAVTVAGHLWISTEATTPEKQRARAEHVARRRLEVEQDFGEPRTRVLGPIPVERRRVALRNYVDRTGRTVEKGSIWDVNEPFVAANMGDLFGFPEAA